MSKVNLGNLSSTQNTFSVFLDSVCAVMALITNCDKSQIATMVSQFVTVAICDGSKHNFSDRFHSNRGYTPKCIKHVHKAGTLGGVFIDNETHKSGVTKYSDSWFLMRQFKYPSIGSIGEPGHPLFEFIFSPDAGISPRANRIGKHAYQAHLDRKYTSENIYARCQSSVGYLAW